MWLSKIIWKKETITLHLVSKNVNRIKTIKILNADNWWKEIIKKVWENGCTENFDTFWNIFRSTQIPTGYSLLSDWKPQSEKCSIHQSILWHKTPENINALSWDDVRKISNYLSRRVHNPNSGHNNDKNPS